MGDEEVTVYVVTRGEYSDYRIDSIWSTRERAQARLGLLHDIGGYENDCAEIKGMVVDPTDIAAQRKVYRMYAHVDGNTGNGDDTWGAWNLGHDTDLGIRFSPRGAPGSMLAAENAWSMVVTAETEERARKVMSEQLAQIKARIDQTGPLNRDKETT